MKLLSLFLLCGALLLTTSFPEECFTEKFTFFTVCVVTVHYTGDPPTFQELVEMPHEEREEVVRPLLCPCNQGSIGVFCPRKVFDVTNPFRHKNLCASFTPDLMDM